MTEWPCPQALISVQAEEGVMSAVQVTESGPGPGSGFSTQIPAGNLPMEGTYEKPLIVL